MPEVVKAAPDDLRDLFNGMPPMWEKSAAVCTVYGQTARGLPVHQVVFDPCVPFLREAPVAQPVPEGLTHA